MRESENDGDVSYSGEAVSASVANSLVAAAMLIAIGLGATVLYMPETTGLRTALFLGVSALAAVLALAVYFGRRVVWSSDRSQLAGLGIATLFALCAVALVGIVTSALISWFLVEEVSLVFVSTILSDPTFRTYAVASGVALLVVLAPFIALAPVRLSRPAAIGVGSFILLLLLGGSYLALIYQTDRDREAVLTEALARTGNDSCDLLRERLLDDTLRVARRSLQLSDTATYEEALDAARKLPVRSHWVLAPTNPGQQGSLGDVLGRLCRVDHDVVIELGAGQYPWTADTHADAMLGLAGVGGVAPGGEEKVRVELVGPMQGEPAIITLSDTFVIGTRDEARRITFVQSESESGAVMINGDGGALRNSVVRGDSTSPALIVALNGSENAKTVRIEDNVISNERGSGILLYERSKAANDDIVISGNDVARVAIQSLEIGEGNQPTLARNVVKPE